MRELSKETEYLAISIPEVQTREGGGCPGI